MIHCCLCDHSNKKSICSHILSHNFSVKQYLEMFPGMPVMNKENLEHILKSDKIDGISIEDLQAVKDSVKPVRRSKIEHKWPETGTEVVLVKGGEILISASGIISGTIVKTNRFISGRAIKDSVNLKLYSSPSEWFKARANGIPCSNGWDYLRSKKDFING
ncbi:MAG: hypothetical protein ABIA63_10790 [bacterium]